MFDRLLVLISTFRVMDGFMNGLENELVCVYYRSSILDYSTRPVIP